MKLRILLSGLALMAATALVSAQTGSNTNAPKDTPVKGQAFVDNNSDGVCDNYQAGKAGQGNRQGICNGKRQGACKGQAQGLAQGNGQGVTQAKGVCNGKGKGQAKDRNFVDANNDGVCDNFKEPTKK